MRAFNPLSIKTVRKISGIKKEPNWMLQFRLEALNTFKKLKRPNFGPDLSDLNFRKIKYYVDPDVKKQTKWQDVPLKIKETFDKLGIPEAEKEILSGVEAQFDSEAIYGSLKKHLEDQGVIFTNIETGLQRYPELFRKYFGTLVKVSDNKFSALNSAVWSGGSFLYVPKGLRVELPLQAYFQIGVPNLGQFERTLIIADEGSYVHYVEGCTAPIYSEKALHAGVVEVFVEKEATVRYSTIQNWSKNVYNLTTKKALVKEKGKMIWVDGNIGSRVTMKYPACYLVEPHAYGEMLSVTITSEKQEMLTGARMIHLAPQTKSKVISKSIAKQGGIANYKGDLTIKKNSDNSRAYIQCDSLLLDNISSSQSYPTLKVYNPTSVVTHEASATRLEEEKLQYLQTRGLTTNEARDLIIKGFVDPIIRELPIEYALEFNKLLEMEIE
jgi:Fe-S cluster assembly protein SufB